ncbi:hypothetical protein GCM10023189_32210 [Nibrella saemangeumensis]|uniref:O-antigen ligase like membrane protein n=2 Tax=Nibrella saemangeumensis TaxID=1084526 RepID=A0ABP8N057_9BACT
MSSNERIIQTILATWVKFALPSFFLFLPFFIYGDAIGRYLVPISFLLLFFPVIQNKWKILIISFSLFVLLSDLAARSNIIKFIVPFIFSVLYYFRLFLSVKFFELIRLLLCLLPICLFYTGITGIFNVFKIDEYIGEEFTTTSIEVGEKVEQNLKVDTRTFLYIEVLSSALKNDYYWFGRTPARGNESASFGSIALEELKTGKMERFSNEVSILNIFTWTGVIGVVLYFFIFYHSSYLAINKSNNFIIKIIGLCVTFRWAYAWVEDFSLFDLSNIFLWIMIGMCYSVRFRAMSDNDITIWIRGVFDKRYHFIPKIDYDKSVRNNAPLY